MDTFFKEVAKDKARKMLKSNILIESFDILVSEHNYKLNIKLNSTTKHKFLSYVVLSVDNLCIESCELLSF